MEREMIMDRDGAIWTLEQAGFRVRPSGDQWHIAPPPGSPGAELVPDGTCVAEWTMIALAKAVHFQSSPTYRMQQASRWN